MPPRNGYTIGRKKNTSFYRGKKNTEILHHLAWRIMRRRNDDETGRGQTHIIAFHFYPPP